MADAPGYLQTMGGSNQAILGEAMKLRNCKPQLHDMVDPPGPIMMIADDNRLEDAVDQFHTHG